MNDENRYPEPKSPRRDQQFPVDYAVKRPHKVHRVQRRKGEERRVAMQNRSNQVPSVKEINLVRGQIASVEASLARLASRGVVEVQVMDEIRFLQRKKARLEGYLQRLMCRPWTNVMPTTLNFNEENQ